jgi:3,4-dihydroxy 2-butanone 4-phosphate synthase/GTP cyclohydrolase II
VNSDVHLALARGRLDGPEVPLVRVHVADTLRDLIGIRAKSRAWTLRAAMNKIAQVGNGVVVILSDHESPNDLATAVRALAMPGAAASATGTHGTSGAHTAATGAHGTSGAHGAAAGASATSAVTSEQQPVYGPEVLRTYGVGAQILKDLGVRRMRVLSAPKQIHGISAFDLEIDSYVGEDG